MKEILKEHGAFERCYKDDTLDRARKMLSNAICDLFSPKGGKPPVSDEEKVIEIIASALSDNDVRPRAREIMALIQQAKEEAAREIFEEIEKHTTLGRQQVVRFLGEEHIELFIGWRIPKDDWQSLKSKHLKG